MMDRNGATAIASSNGEFVRVWPLRGDSSDASTMALEVVAVSFPDYATGAYNPTGIVAPPTPEKRQAKKYDPFNARALWDKPQKRAPKRPSRFVRCNQIGGHR